MSKPESRGKARNLEACEVALSSYAYPENIAEGITRSTCTVMAHAAKDQGAGTLCEGCRSGKGCTERFVYAKGGVALLQGHVAGCETQVLAQLKTSFPGGVFNPASCLGLLSGRFAVPCSLTPGLDGARTILDPEEWATAMLTSRVEYIPETAKGGRTTDGTINRIISQMRAIPVVPPGWKPEGNALPPHPQDDHRSYFFFRFQPADPSDVTLQAVHVRSELSKHPSWATKWYQTPEGKAYLDLARPEQRDLLLQFLSEQIAAGDGKKKKRARTVPDMGMSVGPRPKRSPVSLPGSISLPKCRVWILNTSTW